MTESNSITNLDINPTAKREMCFEASYFDHLEYSKSLEIQKKLFYLAHEKNQISVIGLQHPQIITLGRRASEHVDVALNDHNLPVTRSTRGGLATLHSVGQLVIYPIVNLRFMNLGIRNYVQILLQSTKSLLSEYGIETTLDIKGAGLFTKTGKIAFCGIEVSKGITQHGISLNVRNDLDLFSVIKSCGIDDMQLDRMQNYLVYESMEDLFNKWINYFKTNLEKPVFR